jgi:organic hydroperoxide reductase OsmC/OhrA
VARFAPLYDVPVDDATPDVRATFFNTEKYDLDDAPAYFEEVQVRLAIDSPAPASAVARLAAHAERACHAAQSLRHPVPVTLATTHNGEPLEPLG